MTQTIRLRAAQARKYPHPNKSISPLNRMNLLVRCADMPADISFKPNPREANAKSRNKKVYHTVKRSLLGDTNLGAGFFDLMNRGIVLIVKSVQFVEKDSEGFSVFDLEVPDGYGLADGGHTFRIIAEVNADPALRSAMEAHNQHVEVRVVELPDLDEADTLIPAIGSGLNSSLQVDEMSIANLSGDFEPLKRVLESRFADEIEDYAKSTDHEFEALFGWKQTDKAHFDAKDILTLTSTLDPTLWSKSHPVAAYSSASTLLAKVLREKRQEKYLKIVGDVLELYSYIQGDFRSKYNQAGNKRGGRLSIVEKSRDDFSFPLVELDDSEYRLMKGAAIPMLAAFRVLVEEDEDGNLVWEQDTPSMRKLWEDYSKVLIDRTVEGASKHNRNVANAIGKDATHWRSLHDGVALERLVGGL